MARKLILALASAAALLCAGTAHASGVTWTIGINAPGIGTVISNAPVYGPAPVFYEEPAPVVYRQPRVVYQPPHVIYPEPQVVYPLPQVVFRPVPVVYERGPGQWVPPGHRREWDRDGRRWHHEGRGDHRDERGSRYGY
jgi:hypothetical protein